MSLEQLISGEASPEAIWSIIQTTWAVPAGMLALYFYGRFHFNSPEYPLGLSIGTEQSDGDRVQLITPAPPIFTTQRSRYERYANTYVLILELAFLGFIFFYSIFSDIGRILKWQFPDISAESLQYRAILGLFMLTGLLSSFPVFKEIDTWLLSRFHRAAFIPDDARDLAERLFTSTFEPSQTIKENVRSALSMRDTRRVASGDASGSLEKRIFELLCLRTRVQKSMAADKLKGFRIRLGPGYQSHCASNSGLTVRSQGLS